MPRPLNEMELPEVIEILTPTQKNSLLAYARQLARNALSPNPTWTIDGRVQKPKDQTRQPAAFKRTAVAADSRKGKKKTKRKKNRGGVNTKANLKTPRIVQGGLCSPR